MSRVHSPAVVGVDEQGIAQRNSHPPAIRSQEPRRTMHGEAAFASCAVDHEFAASRAAGLPSACCPRMRFERHLELLEFESTVGVGMMRLADFRDDLPAVGVHEHVEAVVAPRGWSNQLRRSVNTGATRTRRISPSRLASAANMCTGSCGPRMRIERHLELLEFDSTVGISQVVDHEVMSEFFTQPLRRSVNTGASERVGRLNDAASAASLRIEDLRPRPEVMRFERHLALFNFDVAVGVVQEIQARGSFVQPAWRSVHLYHRLEKSLQHSSIETHADTLARGVDTCH